MRAVWYDRQGPADEVLVTGELPTPEPKLREVQVRLEASGVNPSDTYRRRGAVPAEYPRVHSPSAEVQGHGPGQEVLQTGKREVELTALEPVGNYAVQPTFSDGHNTGIFSWDYLYFLGSQQPALWKQYEERLAAAGAQRDAPMGEAAGSSCGHKH